MSHPLFLTKQSIYIVVWNMTDSQKEIESSLEYWLHSIQLKAPDSSVIVVGTHLDLIQERERRSLQPPSTIVSKFSNLVSEWISVSCTTGEGIHHLENHFISLVIEDKSKYHQDGFD